MLVNCNLVTDIATVVWPPPMSMMSHQIQCSLLRTEFMIAKGEIITPSTSLCAQLSCGRLCRIVRGPVCARPRISKRTPIIPRGSRILETIHDEFFWNKGNRFTVSRSLSKLIWQHFQISDLWFSLVSEVTIPCVVQPKRFAGRPTLTDLIEIPAFSSACVIADLIVEALLNINTPVFDTLTLALLTPLHLLATSEPATGHFNRASSDI